MQQLVVDGYGRVFDQQLLLVETFLLLLVVMLLDCCWLWCFWIAELKLQQQQQQRRRCWTWGSRRGFQSRSFMKRKIAEAAGAAAGVLKLVCCCGVVCGLCIVRVAAASFLFKSQAHAFKSQCTIVAFFHSPTRLQKQQQGQPAVGAAD